MTPASKAKLKFPAWLKASFRPILSARFCLPTIPRLYGCDGNREHRSGDPDQDLYDNHPSQLLNADRGNTPGAQLRLLLPR